MTMALKRASGLGRGLSALLGDVTTHPAAEDMGGHSGLRMIALGEISAHPNQPRRHFDEEALNELARSIAAQGLLQPIVVRPHGNGYQIVAGERRWRAAQRAQLHEVPVLIRDIDEATTFELALIENIQRQELNAVEEAEAYRRLMTEFGHTQEALGKLVHKSRSHVANLVRLLDLPDPVLAAVADGRLSMGHARALVTTSDPTALAGEIERRGLSVRETEKLAKAGRPVTDAGAAKAKDETLPPMEYKSLDADVGALERHLADMLGLKVKIAHSTKGGTVVLNYASLEQLDLICQRLSGERF